MGSRFMRFNKKVGWRGRDQNSSQEGLYLNLKKKKETNKQIVHAEFQMYYRFCFFFIVWTPVGSPVITTLPHLLTPEPYPDCHLRISLVQRVSTRVALLDKRSFAVPTSRLTSTTETVKTKRKNSPMVIIGNGTVASLDQSTTKISV